MDKHHILASLIGALFDKARGGVVDLQTMRVDLRTWERWERLTANAGANGGRVWPCDPHGITDKAKLYCPYPLDTTGKFDTTRFRPEYFEDRRKMQVISRSYNKTLWNVIFDNCGFHRDGPLTNPWTAANNLRGRTFYQDTEASLLTVQRFVAELGKDAYFEVCNECAWGPGWQQGKGNVAWFAAMYEELIDLGVPADHISFGAELEFTYDKKTKRFKVNSLHDIIGQAAEILRKHGIPNATINASYYACHNVGGAPETVDGVLFPFGYDTQFAVQTWPANSPRKPFASDDGIGQGDPVYQPDGRFTRPKPAALHISTKHLLDNVGLGRMVIECLTYDIQVIGQMAAINMAYRDVYGVELENRGKYPEEIPEPEPEPEPEPDPEPEPEPLPKPTIKITWQFWAGLCILIVLAIVIIGAC